MAIRLLRTRVTSTACKPAPATRNVGRTIARSDHTTTSKLLRRPFVMASCGAITRAIDSTPVTEMETTVEAGAVAAFSAPSFTGHESAIDASQV